MRYLKYINYIIVVSFILLFNISGKAQSDSTSFTYKLLGESEDKSTSIYVGKFNYRDAGESSWQETKYFYEIIMVINATKDTCVISPSECVTKYIDSIDIKTIGFDKNKRKGIILKLYMREHSNLGEHGGYDIDKTINEIWDLKKHTRLFSATNTFHFNSDFYTYYEDDSTSTAKYADYNYTYDFSIVNGEIVINNIKIDCKEKLNDETAWTSISEAHIEYVEGQLPDHEEGVYMYHKGKYIRKKEKDTKRH